MHVSLKLAGFNHVVRLKPRHAMRRALVCFFAIADVPDTEQLLFPWGSICLLSSRTDTFYSSDSHIHFSLFHIATVIIKLLSSNNIKQF